MELPANQGGLQTGPPKSSAGERDIVLPATLGPMLAAHLEQFTGANEDDFLFTSRTGAPVRPKALWKAFNKVCDGLGLCGLHFHDLRHFAVTEAANAGATLRDLMARAGWSNEKMALRYMHTSDGRDRQIAEQMAHLVQVPKSESADEPSHPIASNRGNRNGKCSRKLPSTSPTVRPSGFEPETCGLRVRCSAVELEAHRRV